MARKRRTAAEMAEEREKQQAEFERKLQAYRQNHTPEECSCAEQEAEFGGNPSIFQASKMTQAASEMARAVKLGCTDYIWRTARDGGVCPRCEDNADQVFRYDRPPPGGHPGTVPGCRCYAEAVIPNVGRGAREASTRAKPKMSRFAKIFWIILGLTIIALMNPQK